MPDTAGLGDLWIRASRLRESCDISVDVEARPPGWRVIFTPKETGHEPVEAVSDHLLDAMGLAINRAEAAGLSPGRYT